MLPNSQNGKSVENLSADVYEAGELTEHWHVILGHRWTILAIAAIVALGFLVYFSILPNLYTGEVQILVEKVDNAPKSYQQLVMPMFNEEDEYYGTQVAILTGRRIARTVQSELNVSPGTYSIDARRLRGTRIIGLSVKHKDPQMAAKIANKYAEVFMRENMRDNLFIPQQLLKWLPGESESSKGQFALDQMEGVDKKEFVQSLNAVANDPVVQSLKNEKLGLEAQQREMSQRYKSQHPVIKDLNDRLSKVADDIDERTKKVVSQLKANISGEMQFTNIKVLQEAIPPSTPSEPNRVRGVLLGCIFGLGLGIAIVLFVEHTNQKVRAEEDIRSSISIPFIGYVPFTKDLLKNKKDFSKSGNFSNGLSIIGIIKKNSELSDSAANIRTRILFSMPYELSKMMMLTSVVPDEGKSTVSLLLSLSFAASNEKVLLVDADMRRPFLHHYLNIPNSKGLTDFLIGSASLDQVVHRVEGVARFSVVTAGNKSPNPVGLLESNRFQEFLDSVSSDFDRIIIDAPPVLHIPDGMIIAKRVHNTVLVCGSGMTHKKMIKTVQEKFDSIARPFSGIVINRADFEYGAYSYKNKYYRSYKNYYSVDKEALLK